MWHGVNATLNPSNGNAPMEYGDDTHSRFLSCHPPHHLRHILESYTSHTHRGSRHARAKASSPASVPVSLAVRQALRPSFRGVSTSHPRVALRPTNVVTEFKPGHTALLTCKFPIIYLEFKLYPTQRNALTVPRSATLLMRRVRWPSAWIVAGVGCRADAGLRGSGIGDRGSGIGDRGSGIGTVGGPGAARVEVETEEEEAAVVIQREEASTSPVHPTGRGRVRLIGQGGEGRAGGAETEYNLRRRLAGAVGCFLARSASASTKAPTGTMLGRSWAATAFAAPTAYSASSYVNPPSSKPPSPNPSRRRRRLRRLRPRVDRQRAEDLGGANALRTPSANIRAGR
ncbi:hypothetical protein B0H10DRAFT_522417 [Mycena sp. CBHHK59/15]|nr:hypothetical protein B0H10DRAFT_522417 [Mycena sp. CBHHK59/15]